MKNSFAKLVYGAQFLYGGWFLFHGLNYWFEFYPDRSIQPGPGLVPALAESGVMALVKLLEVLIGLLLLTNRFAALAIVAAWPITLMIAFVTASHGKPFGIGVAVVIISLNALMSLAHLDRYLPMLAPHAGRPNLDGMTEFHIRNGERLSARAAWIGGLGGLIAAIAITYASLYLRR